jgi:hypothetical protein
MISKEELIELAHKSFNKEAEKRDRLYQEYHERSDKFEELQKELANWEGGYQIEVLKRVFTATSLRGRGYHQRFMIVVEKERAKLERESEEESDWINYLLRTSNNS